MLSISFWTCINLKSQRKDIPKEIESFYEKEKYLKALAYNSERIEIFIPYICI